MPAEHSNAGRVDFEFGINDEHEVDARFEEQFRDALLTPKPGETVEVYRNHDSGDQSTVITDAQGNRRGHATFTVSGVLTKGTL